MNQGAHSRRRPGMVGAGALALVLGAAVGAPASAAPASAASAAPAGSPVGGTATAVPAALGAAAVRNQQDLTDFKMWLTGRPGLVESGFFESAVDVRTRRMTLLWHGRSPLQAAAVAEGRRRGLRVLIKPVAYTRASVDRAVRALMAPGSAAELGGFQVTAISGPTDTVDHLTVTGIPAATAKGRPDAAVRSLAGMETVVREGRRSVVFATRSTDVTPFNAGGQMRSDGGSACTNGFAIAINGGTWTTTARHCVASRWTAWDRPSSVYGNGSNSTTDAGTGSRLLSGNGIGVVYTGAWNDPNGPIRKVGGVLEPSIGDYLCTSGANSGMHCAVQVTSIYNAFHDGFGWFRTIGAVADSGIAAAHGDSGGPVFLLTPDRVLAAGMIQGTSGPETSACGSLRIPTTCATEVEFSSEADLLRNFGATLVTS